MSNNISFLENQQSIYYTALDTRAFPDWDRRAKKKLSFNNHIAYIKALSLLVDNIVIPPTYLIELLEKPGSSFQIRKLLGEFIEDKTIITTSYANMSSTLDFVEMKKNQGSNHEKMIFSERLKDANELYGSMPLLRRDVSKQSSDFKVRFFSKLNNLSSINDYQKQQIINKLNSNQNIENGFSRKNIIEILNNSNFNRKEYRSIYYLMNAEYYRGGAISSFSNIACVNVHNYSVLGKNIFSDNKNGIVVGYDPEIFLYVLNCHNITTNEILALSYKDINELRHIFEFSEFVKQYNRLVTGIQKIRITEKYFGKDKIYDLRYEIISELFKRYKLEEKYYKQILTQEDFGVALVLGSLGFILGGIIGASVLALLGVSHPLLRQFSISPVEIIIRKLQVNKVSFHLYIDTIEEIASQYTD